MASYDDGAELFEACLTQATAVVKQVRPEHFANPTPDADSSVRDLLAHMLQHISEVPDVVAGLTPAETASTHDTELLDEDDTIDVSIDWQTAADKAELAITEIDPDETAHLASGEITLEDYLMQAASTLLIHTWDLGKAIGVAVKFDDQLANIIYKNTKAHREQLHDRGMFTAQVEVIGDVDIQTRLLALFGRRADWRAGTAASG